MESWKLPQPKKINQPHFELDKKQINGSVAPYLQVEALLPARREGMIGVELEKLRR